jgi:hypothetical protein
MFLVFGTLAVCIVIGVLIMSVDSLVQAASDLKGSIDSAVAKLGQAPPPPVEDPRIQEVTDQLVADKAALDAALNPPA